MGRDNRYDPKKFILFANAVLPYMIERRLVAHLKTSQQPLLCTTIQQWQQLCYEARVIHHRITFKGFTH